MYKSYQKSLSSREKGGFTLIELLVVVLIIGILSAVAVPMYQTAVDKSRFSTLFAIANAFKEDQEIFYLANSRYSQDLNELQSSLPSGWTIDASGSTASSGSQELRLDKPTFFVVGNREERTNSLVFYYDHTFSSSVGKKHCYAYNAYGERGVRVCQSLGGVLTVADGCNGACKVYTLP